MIGEGTAEVIQPIAQDLGGSVASSALGFFGDNILGAIDDLAMPFVNKTIEDFVKSNSRLEKMRIWFNNKGNVVKNVDMIYALIKLQAL